MKVADLQYKLSFDSVLY